MYVHFNNICGLHCSFCILTSSECTLLIIIYPFNLQGDGISGLYRAWHFCKRQTTTYFQSNSQEFIKFKKIHNIKIFFWGGHQLVILCETLLWTNIYGITSLSVKAFGLDPCTYCLWNTFM